MHSTGALGTRTEGDSPEGANSKGISGRPFLYVLAIEIYLKLNDPVLQRARIDPQTCAWKHDSNRPWIGSPTGDDSRHAIPFRSVWGPFPILNKHDIANALTENQPRPSGGSGNVKGFGKAP